MSSYEWYEFRAIDRELSTGEMEELRRYSSRANITKRSFSVEYNYGSFKGQPEELVAKYFDVFVYVSSWEQRQLIMRMPVSKLPAHTVDPYKTDRSVTCRQVADHLLLSLAHFPEEGHEWAEGEGWMELLAPLRSALLCGDLRALHFAWLAGVDLWEVDDEAVEPPVPQGLGDWRSTGLSDLCNFLSVGEDLIDAAAERSEPLPGKEEMESMVSNWVSGLPEVRKSELLASLVAGNVPGLGESLFAQATKRTGTSSAASTVPLRTVAQIRARSRELENVRRRREHEEQIRHERRQQEEAERRRAFYISSLVGGEEGLWSEIHGLLDSTNTKKYVRCVELLVDLRDLAARDGKQEEFNKRLLDFCASVGNRPALIRRMEQSGLI